MTADATSSWRLAKAERFLTAAQRSLDAGDWETAASRAYYAAYHAAVEALEVQVGVRRRRWDHIDLHRTFRLRLAKTGRYSVRTAEWLEQLHQARLLADYEKDPPTARQSGVLVENARRFVQEVKENIGNV